jgi:hypothetical protein
VALEVIKQVALEAIKHISGGCLRRLDVKLMV